MATYKEIQQAVKEKYDFTPKTCWIAHVLSDYGKTKRLAPNRTSRSSRVYPCPEEKRTAIEKVIRNFKMI